MVFRTIHLQSEYWQISVGTKEVSKQHSHLLGAFRTFGETLGLTKAPMREMDMMDVPLGEYLDRLFKYSKNIMVESASLEERNEHLHQVLIIWREKRLNAKPQPVN